MTLYGWVAFLDMEVVVHLPHLKGSHARLLVEPVYATRRLRSDSESNSSTIPNTGSLISENRIIAVILENIAVRCANRGMRVGASLFF